MEHLRGTEIYEGSKGRILDALFSGDALNSDQLREISGQTEWNRRLRELLSDGWKIESVRIKEQDRINTYYQLKSRKLKTPDASFKNQVNETLKRVSDASPSKIQEVAASQLELLSVYHNVALEQAKKSFTWALLAAGIGLIFLVSSVTFILASDSIEAAIISLISGALIEFISGINFVLYGKASSQLADFQKRLEVTQRFLLANSLCESLDGEQRNTARTELIKTMASSENVAV